MRALAFGKKIAYAAPAFALAVVGIPVYVYLPKFYTDVVGVHISALGVILLIVRLFDAVTDPAIGLISDKTGLSREDAYSLSSLAVDLRVTQIVNPKKGIHAMVPKYILGNR